MASKYSSPPAMAIDTAKSYQARFMMEGGGEQEDERIDPEQRGADEGGGQNVRACDLRRRGSRFHARGTAARRAGGERDGAGGRMEALDGHPLEDQVARSGFPL